MLKRKQKNKQTSKRKCKMVPYSLCGEIQVSEIDLK